jgi:hypothetical protein
VPPVHPAQKSVYVHALHVRKVKEIETGGRPTPIDEPILIRSDIVNNVGFSVNDKNIIPTLLG